MHNKTRTRQGFTLIEMAVVLLIVGVILSVSLPFFSDLSKRRKHSEADDYLKRVKDQVIGFALSQSPHRLPTSAEFTNLGVGQDPFGNDAQYDYATGLDTASTLCSSTSTSMVVQKDSAGSSTNNVAFVLISYGSNRQQEVDDTVGVDTYRYYVRNYPVDHPGTGRDYDDSFQFATLNEIKTRVCTSAATQEAPTGSDVSFAANLADGTSFVPQAAAQTDGKNAIRVDANTGEVELGANEDNAVYACLWYTGDVTSKCTSGVCDWPADGTAATVRAYFTFTFKNQDSSDWSTDYGDGFTFTIATADNSVYTNSATCCGSSSQYMGYAGTGGAAGTGINPPKFGVEIDTRGNNGPRDPEYYDRTTGTPVYMFYNHAAIVLWDWGNANQHMASNSDNYHYRSAGLTVNVNQDVEDTDYDPTVDPAPYFNYCDGSADTYPSATSQNSTWRGQEARPARTNPSIYTQDASYIIPTAGYSANTTYYADGGPFTDYKGDHGAIWDAAKAKGNTTSTSGTYGATWLEDGQIHSIRFEISRAANDYTGTYCYTSTISGRRQVNTSRKFTIKVWIDSTSAGLTDLTADLGGTPTIQKDVYLVTDSTYANQFDQFRFGWTYGHATGVESGVTIADFGIKFAW